MSYNVLIPMRDEKIVNEIEKQLGVDDALTVFSMPAYPLRLLDELFTRTKHDKIILINPETEYIPEDFMDSFRSATITRNIYLRRYDDIVETYIKGTVNDLKYDDSLCFYKNSYKRNLKDYSNKLNYNEIIKLLILKSNFVVSIPSSRVSPDYNDIVNKRRTKEIEVEEEIEITKPFVEEEVEIFTKKEVVKKVVTHKDPKKAKEAKKVKEPKKAKTVEKSVDIEEYDPSSWME